MNPSGAAISAAPPCGVILTKVRTMPARLTKATKVLIDHAIRQYRTLDVMTFIEEDLTAAQTKAAEAYLERLKKVRQLAEEQK